MSKKLLDILPTLQTFQDNVISQLTNMFNGVEWLNDTTSYTKQETIYKLLILKYGDRHIRYDDENIFLNRLVFDLADFLPDIYAKQQVFIKNKLNEFLSDNKNRAVVIDNTSTNTRNTDNNSKLGNSASPLNLVISNASEITNAPITSLNLSNVKLLENYNGNNQQVNYNFVNDLIKTLNSDYSLRLNEFMELLGKHFISVVGSYYRNSNDIQTVKDEPYRFNNGYLVNEVDYLCADNKQEINRFNETLGRLNDQVATKQNQLTAGNNISINNNVISANIPQPDLSNYLQKNGNLQIVNAFVDFYGNIVAKNNGYVDNVDTQAPTSMVNIRHLNNTLNPINTEIARVDGVVATNSTNIVNLDNKVNTNTSNISSNTNNITTLQNKINNEVVKLSGEQNISGVKTITASGGEALKFNSGTNNSAYIAGYKSGNNRIWYFGKGSSTDDNFVVGSTATIKLQAGREINANKIIVAEQGLKTGASKDITAMNLELGFGGSTAYLTPEDNTNKTLKLHGKPNKGKFDLDFNGQAKIINLPDPTADQDAANKRYVDNLNNQNVKLTGDQSIGGNKTFTQPITIPTPTADTNAATKQYVDTLFNRRVQNATINVGAQTQFRAQSGYEIVNVMVGRKRNDNYMFFTHNEQLNFQVFVHTNGQWTVYNGGTPNRFTNEFQITILEKKV